MSKAKMFAEIAAETEDSRREASLKKVDYERKRSAFENPSPVLTSEPSSPSTVSIVREMFSTTSEEHDKQAAQQLQVELEAQRRKEEFHDKASQFQR